MPLPQVSNRTLKVISFTSFAVISALKVICIFIISGQMDVPCIAGWHVNQELSNFIILLVIGLVPDILMLVSIAFGMAFKASNIGADPATIVYNFIVGLLSICSAFSFITVEDCKSNNLTKIKLSAIFAGIAGVLQIANGVICLLLLAPEERYEPEVQLPVTSTPETSRTSRLAHSSPKTSKKSKSESSNLKNLKKSGPSTSKSRNEKVL